MSERLLSDYDILDMIVDSHIINAGAFEALGLTRAMQANVIETLESNSNPLVNGLRNYLVSVLRDVKKPPLSVILGGKSEE